MIRTVQLSEITENIKEMCIEANHFLSPDMAEAMKQAQPILMEPIMKVSVTVPDEYTGTVIGDLSSRRGQIQGMEAMAGTQRVNAFVPLAQMFGYATDLRSKTQGRGQYVMEPSHYEPVPKNIADQIIAGRTKG